jgi:hypothetical protein
LFDRFPTSLAGEGECRTLLIHPLPKSRPVMQQTMHLYCVVPTTAVSSLLATALCWRPLFVQSLTVGARSLMEAALCLAANCRRPLSHCRKPLSVRPRPLSVWPLTVGDHSLIVDSRSLCRAKSSVGCRSLLKSSRSLCRAKSSVGCRSLLQSSLC